MKIQLKNNQTPNDDLTLIRGEQEINVFDKISTLSTKTFNAATITIEDTEGTPSATATINNNTLEMQFTSIKGEDGDKGKQGPDGIIGNTATYNSNVSTLFNVANTTGNSTTKTMTQKAITDLFQNITLGIMDTILDIKRIVKIYGDNLKLLSAYFVIKNQNLILNDITKPGNCIENIQIIMGNDDITSTAYSNNVINISSVTDNVTITIETTSVTDTNMFTKRTTGNGISILNNKALLKGVRGNTMNFYQKLDNPDFSNGDTNWQGRVNYGNTLSVTDGILTVSSNANYDINVLQANIFTEAHLYLCIAKVRVIAGPTGYNFRFGNSGNNYNAGVLAELNKWYTASCIIDFSGGAPTTNPNKWFMLKYQKSSTIEVDWTQCIDLTRLLGSQSENISYNTFHKLFPLNVYNQGNIIINNSMTNYVSKDENEETLQNVSLNVPTLRGLPESFTLPYDSQVEYVDKSGTDDTSRFFIDYIPNGTDVVIKAKLRVTGYANSVTYSTILGSFTSGKNQYRLARYNNSTSQVCGQMACSNYGDAIPFSLNEDHIVELRYGKTIVDGVEYTNGTTSSGNSNDPIALLAIAFGRLYYCQVYKGNELVADVIPVRIGSDAGFYDRVINKLCVKSVPSSTAWSVGQDVENEKIQIFPKGMKSTVCLPSVTPSYIYKNDSFASYINLDYVPTGQDIVIKGKITLSSYITTSGNLVWVKAGTGTTGSSTSKNWYGIVRGAANSYIIAFCGNRNDKSIGSITAGTTYEFELSFGNLKLNGTDYTIDTTIGVENTESIKVLNGINGYLYYLQVYKGEDLVVDCVPYRNGEIVGLYDRARDRIFLPSLYGGTITSYEPTYEELPEPTFDEIKQEDGIWKAYKRISDVRVDNTVNTSRTEYAPLAQEEVYILDDQTIPTELTVANQGTEEILPTNGATPTTAPAIMEIQYPSIPTRGGFLLGNMNNNNENDNIDDTEEIEEEEEIIEE